MKIDIKRKRECIQAECGLDKERCLIKFGKLCIRNGGSKIPVQTATSNERMALNVEAQTTFKPYYIVDRQALSDGREY